MPLITVWNYPSTWEKSPFIQCLKKSAIDIKELNLTTEDVSVAFAGEQSMDHLDKCLIIMVELLFDKPERTIEVRRQLAGSLGKAAKIYLETRVFLGWKVEVAVKRFNPDKDAFWTS